MCVSHFIHRCFMLIHGCKSLKWLLKLHWCANLIHGCGAF